MPGVGDLRFALIRGVGCGDMVVELTVCCMYSVGGGMVQVAEGRRGTKLSSVFWMDCWWRRRGEGRGET